MTRRDVNEGDVFRKGFATNALEGGATTGQVPAVASDGQMEFVAAGGGSQPGAWQRHDFLFAEQVTPGTISTTFVLPVGSVILGIGEHGIVNWFDINASLTLEDESGTIHGPDEEAFSTDREFLWAGFDGSFQSGVNQGLGQEYPTGQTLTISYTTTVADPSAPGRSRVSLYYATGVVTTNVP